MRFFISPLAFMLAASVFACGSGKTAGNTSPSPSQMTVFVRPDGQANGGRVFYLVVKEVDESQLSKETYEKVEAMVPQGDLDSDVLGIYAVVPGQELKIVLRKPPYLSTGFYLLLTEPEDRWRVLVRQPIGNKYNLWIGKDRVSIAPRMSSW